LGDFFFVQARPKAKAGFFSIPETQEVQDSSAGVSVQRTTEKIPHDVRSEVRERDRERENEREEKRKNDHNE
jgi:hypothetical protein